MITMQADLYYIGDLCYVMNDTEWKEVCDLICDGPNCLEGGFTLSDGRKFVIFNTSYGDGLYPSNIGHEFPVDSGSIGCIKVSDIKALDNLKLVSMLFKAFTEDFTCENRDGTLYFGDVVINTGDIDPIKALEAALLYMGEEDDHDFL